MVLQRRPHPHPRPVNLLPYMTKGISQMHANYVKDFAMEEYPGFSEWA